MADNGEDFGELFCNPQQLLISESDNIGGVDIEPGEPFSGLTTDHPIGKQESIRGKRSESSSSKNSSMGVDGLPGDAQAGGGGPQIHVTAERKRRKKMRDLFSSLHELLPQLPPKADKVAMLDTVLNYIPILEQTAQRLENQKLERNKGEELPTAGLMSVQGQGSEIPTRHQICLADKTPSADSVSRFPLCFETWSTPNVVLNITGGEAHISISTAKKPGLLTAIFCVMEKYGLEVVSAEESSNSVSSLYMINARATRDSDQFPGASMIAEIFKLAVNEILLLISG